MKNSKNPAKNPITQRSQLLDNMLGLTASVGIGMQLHRRIAVSIKRRSRDLNTKILSKVTGIDDVTSTLIGRSSLILSARVAGRTNAVTVGGRSCSKVWMTF